MFLVFNRFELISVGDLKSPDYENYKWSSSKIDNSAYSATRWQGPPGVLSGDRKMKV